MQISWTNTFTTFFDLEQAYEDFYYIMREHDDNYLDKAIYDAVEANWYFDGEEYVDTYAGIEAAADALRAYIGGYQMRMEGV